MKNRSPLQSGVALVIVLGFLVLISVLVVAFFSSVTTELKSSRNFSSGVTTRQLSESATQIVMGQIRAATPRTRAAWASQPGMIRTYRTNETNAGPEADAFFKLYSSDKMVIQGTGLMEEFADPSRPDFATDWNSRPALWTDLNAPVVVANNTPTTAHPGATVPRFPIIDPRAYAYGTQSRHATDGNPDHLNTEGFWYGSDAENTAVPVGLVAPGGGGDNQRLPMPVRWIYVLQDGTLSSPDAASSTGMIAKWQATGSNSFKAPTKENPIVGRIAFWADDETSKVNINTAGGFVDPTVDSNLVTSGYDVTTYAGSFWDTPRFYTRFDRGMPYREGLGSSGSNKAGTPFPGGGGLAICQLIQGEFQRYPGHPSTTSLGLILGPYLRTPSGPTAAAPYTRSDQMYNILPRLGITSTGVSTTGAGSTKGGIVRIIPSNPTLGGNPIPQDLQINPKPDRLYASVDELYFAADSPDAANSPTFERITMDKWLQSSNNPLPSSTAALSADNVDKLRFFLTTQSRAPELNLFGFPRVTVWPVRFENATENSGLNPFDNIILFCSTIGTDPTAASTGRPNTMKAPTLAQSPLQSGLTPSPTGTNGGPPYRYIFTRRELPATPGGVLPSPATTWTGAASWLPDINQPRNKQLMVYLQRLTAAKIPGFGGSFLTKYGANDRDQTLTEIFDYIRCANLQDTTTKTIGQTTAIQFSSKGQVLPSRPTYLQSGKTYSGFGRMPVISEATIVFYYAGLEKWKTVPTPGVTPQDGGDRNSSDYDTNTGPQRAGMIKVDMDGFPHTRYMRAFMVFSMFSPAQGYAPTKDPATAEPKLIIDVGANADGSASANNLSKFKARVAGLLGTTADLDLGFPSGKLTTKIYRSSAGAWGGRNFGGFEGFMHTLVGLETHKLKEPTDAAPNGTGGSFLSPMPKNYASNGSVLSGSDFSANQEAYPFQTMENKKIAIPYTIRPTNVPPYDPMALNMPLPISTFDFLGGDLDVVVRYGGDYNTVNRLDQVVQAVKITFPDAFNLPIPKGDVGRDFDANKQVSLVGVLRDGTTFNGSNATSGNQLRPASKPMYDGTTPLDLRDPLDVANTNGNNKLAWVNILAGYGPSVPQTQGANLTRGQLFINHLRQSYWDNTGSFYPAWKHGSTAPNANTTYLTTLDQSWAFARRLAWSQQPSHNPWRNSSNSANLNSFADRWKNIVQPGDTIRSVIFWNTAGGAPPAAGGGKIKGGDLRLAMVPDPGTGRVPEGEFFPHPDYQTKGDPLWSVKAWNGNGAALVSRATSLRLADGNPYFNPGSSPSNNPYAIKTNGDAFGEEFVGTLEPSLGNHVSITGSTQLNGPNRIPISRAQGNLPFSGKKGASGFVNGVIRDDNEAGDFDTGIGSLADGPYINKQDEGNIIFAYQDTATMEWRYPIPYFGTWAYEAPGNTFTSPSRQMPGPGMFGSLPSRAASRKGWETLSFSPNPAGQNHPGNTQEPKDHLLLDLFQMPVVEPYPISEPFSTAGKVNMNYQIRPFSYITRTTALRAALHPVRVTAAEAQNWYYNYKTGDAPGSGTTGIDQYDNEKGTNRPLSVNFRKVIDRDATIKSFDEYLSQGRYNPEKGMFRSATEICERYLYPYGGGLASDTAVKSWWNLQTLVGDNVREKPYVDLYPRLTTKSNTFTVHMRVQTLRQIPRNAAPGYQQWEEGRDAILAEYRGSATIERYIDPADPRFDPTNLNFVNPDDVLSDVNLETIYRFRTVITKKFAPY